ncbi:MAG: DUF308 domain-containing protein [Methanobacteriaceae archaeon]|jgi:uncharacterized membrane protein HdeD (DUF308 family)|nr:MAG: hypothetical protein CIT01_07895 [Methanobacterium sp. BRmetb2]MCC7557836.1 DUF308 domain-containing protein [Methanobacteriaceae archaeon]
MNNKLFGILAIILGLIVIAFPIAGVVAASILTGFIILLIGIWLLLAGINVWSDSKAAAALNLIVGIIALVIGVDLLLNILLFSFLAGFLLYLAGIFLIISGIVSLFARERKYALWGGVISIILGILYIILGTYAFDPLYLGILIGLWLVINGIFLFVEPEE